MMKTVLYTSVLLAVSLLAPLRGQEMGPGRAAAAEMLNLRGVDFDEVQTPAYDPRVRGPTVRDGRRNWLRISAEFDTAPEWIDEMTVTFYVVLRGDPDDLPEGLGPVNMFSGSTTYINVKQARRQSVNMFLDPNTFERYGDPEAIAVLFEINGEQAAGRVEPQRTAEARWWERQTPNAIPLLPRNQTPWALIEIEQHPTIQP